MHASAAPIEIRPLRSAGEHRQCLELQRATWGADYDDLVPPSILTVTQKIGGIAAGAFEPDGRMAGFVFGMAGVRDGRVIHWSDMLAVRADARDRGIGRQLKGYQRDAARATGATVMYWTYDPLVARNAHLNFNRLGVIVDEYIVDMYGASTSDLHRGLGTDRFVVAWPLDERSHPAGPGATTTDAPPATILNPEARSLTSQQLAALDAAPPVAVRVEIPLDIVEVRDAEPAIAASWRVSTRQAFQWALGRGFTVTRFSADQVRGRGSYTMMRTGAGGST